MNRVCLIGRLVRDPELRQTSTGKAVTEFTIAVNKRIKPTDGSPDCDFIRCKAWGQTANYVVDYLAKGRLVSVDGRIEFRKYQDKDGNNREQAEIIADNVSGLDRPRDDDNDTPPRPEPATKGARPRPPVTPAADEWDPFQED